MSTVFFDEAAARELRDDMAALSQYYFSAGWLSELEFLLWNRIAGNPMAISHFDELSREQITHLQDLSAACCGWMRWPSEAENDARPEDDKLWDAVWCPLAEWLDRFTAWSVAWKARQIAARKWLSAHAPAPISPPVSAAPPAPGGTMRPSVPSHQETTHMFMHEDPPADPPPTDDPPTDDDKKPADE